MITPIYGAWWDVEGCGMIEYRHFKIVNFLELAKIIVTRTMIRKNTGIPFIPNINDTTLCLGDIIS